MDGQVRLDGMQCTPTLFYAFDDVLDNRPEQRTLINHVSPS